MPQHHIPILLPHVPCPDSVMRHVMYFHCAHCKKNVSDFPVNFSRPGRVWLVTSRLGMGKSISLLCSACLMLPCNLFWRCYGRQHLIILFYYNVSCLDASWLLSWRCCGPYPYSVVACLLMVSYAVIYLCRNYFITAISSVPVM